MSMDACCFRMLLVILLLGGGWAHHTHYRPRPRYQNIIRLTTYNVALVTNLANSQERKQAQLKALPEHNSDVMCLQEAWTFNEVNDIVTATKKTYPHSYSALHSAVGVINPPSGIACPPASATAIGALVQCLQTHTCVSQPGLLFLVCAVTNCKGQIQVLTQDCLSCLIYSQSNTNLEPTQAFGLILQACSTGPFITNYGLLMLSKKPLSEVKIVKYYDDLAIFPRAYIQAKVDEIGRVVICTHLTFNASASFEVIDRFANEAEKHEFETKKLIHDAAQIKAIAMMGDFNSGPAVPEHMVREEFGQSYSNFTEAGWISPYINLCGECTFCSANINPLNQRTSVYDSLVIDNILVRGNQQRLKLIAAERVFDENVVKVGPKSIPMSDHYGVTVSFKIKPRRSGGWRRLWGRRRRVWGRRGFWRY